MPDPPLEERLAAVERALSDEATDPPAPDAEDLAARVTTLEDDVAELEAAVQAVRGYVGGVKHVNDEVEQRADAAMAKARELERAMATGDATHPPQPPGEPCPRCGGTAGAPAREDSGGVTAPDGARPRSNGHGPDRDGPPPGDGRGPEAVGQRHVGDDAEERDGLLARLREVL